jgi:DNA polymerase-1
LNKMKRFILIDAYALIHRAYHALPPLTAKNGEVVNAVFGFSSILMKTISEFKPDYVAAAFDLAEPTFRHK